MSHPINAFKLPDNRWDMHGYSRSLGERVCARPCPGCGRFAKAVAGDDSVRYKILPDDPEPPGPWCRTECKRCGTWEVEDEFVPGKGWRHKTKVHLEAADGVHR